MNEKTKKLIKEIENDEKIYGGIAEIEFEEYDGQFDVLWPNRPNGDFECMIEYFSDGVCPDFEEKYKGWFSSEDYSGDYIRDAMKDIRKTEALVGYLKNKYKDKVEVVFLDFNKGCQFGCAINIWVKKQ